MFMTYLEECRLFLVVEFQKRGYPHCHLVLRTNAVVTAEYVDKVVSAELPKYEDDPEMFYLVSKYMLHRCSPNYCRSQVTSDGKCKKYYQKDFCNETLVVDGERVKYKRREHKRKWFYGKHPLNNKYIVPYSPILLKKFQCHMNVEIVNSTMALKYITKYITKGEPTLKYKPVGDKYDEIEEHFMSRYLTAFKAGWNLMKYEMSKASHSVMNLHVHLPEEEKIYEMYKKNKDLLNEDQLKEKKSKSKLMAFFNLCKNDSFAKTLTYCEVPNHYVWKALTWTRRQKNVQSFGRLPALTIKHGERYFLKLLLLHVEVQQNSMI